MKLAWLTDIHLNFLDKPERDLFYQAVIATNADCILITGDIAESDSIVELLNEAENAIQKPIHFVLGNHDYYRSSVSSVFKDVNTFTKNHPLLHWVKTAGAQSLTKDTILLGQDSWADGRYGDYTHSRVALNDSRLIADLFQAKILGKKQLLEKMQWLADADAAQLKIDLENAIAKEPKQIIIALHVPPFKESAIHEGKISDDDYLPFFASKVMGDLLLTTASKYPMIQFLVLCGHTHSEGEYQALPNLLVKTGAAEYYRPRVAGVLLV